MLSQSGDSSLHNKIMAVDLSYLIHRSYKAGDKNPKESSDPVPEVVLQTIARLNRDLRPCKIHLAVEAGHDHRDKLLATYKDRPDKDEGLVADIDATIKACIEAGHSVLYSDGLEADDVIATMAHTKPGEILVVTADKDLHQLADVCCIYHPYDRVEVTLDDVVQRWGVSPSLLGDVLALNGDKADHIPGIDKIGPKTAANLLKEYGDLEGILEVADAMAEKTKKVTWRNLSEGADQARISRKLVQLIIHAEIQTATLDDCPWSQRRNR